MRKLSLAGGLVLSLAAATFVFAATPAPQLAATTSHLWKTAYRDGSVRTTGVLTASSTYTSGHLVIHITGATKGEKVTLTFFDRVGTTARILASRTITANSLGRYAGNWNLTFAELKALKALPATAHRDLETLAAGKLVAGLMVGK